MSQKRPAVVSTPGASAPRRHPSTIASHTSSGTKRPASRGLGARPARALRRNGPKPHQPHPKYTATPFAENAGDVTLPPLPTGAVRIIALGGVEEVGRNMLLVETNDGIIISDMGFQFTEEDSNPGIDYILPNTRYLEQNKHRILGIFITHAHLDHIGGIPYLIERIGNPTIYTRYLSSLMIKKRQAEFPHMPELDIKLVEPGERVRLKDTVVEIFSVTHSIPDSMGIAIETPHGRVLVSGDLRLEHEDGTPTEKEEKVWGNLGSKKNLLFIADSTSTEIEGFSIPESRVHATLEEIIKTTKGRLFIGSFASQFERMIKIIELAEKYGKKVVMEGRSVKTNLEVAIQGKLFVPKKDTLIEAGDMAGYPPDKLLILATGAQGEEFAALMRIATKKHKFIAFNDKDTVVLSSSVIPGNELSVQKLKDNLYRNDVKLIHYKSADVHSGGHGRAGEIVWMRQKIAPRFFMPAYGYHSMLRCNANAQIESGFPKKDVIMADNGMVIDIVDGEKVVIHKEKVQAGPMMVDGFSIGNVQEVVIRDRQLLAQDGMFVIIATVSIKTGKLVKSPDIISRGFVYLRESQELLQLTRIIIKKNIEDSSAGMQPVNFDLVKNNVTDAVARFLFEKTNKRPIVIPVILGV